MLPFDIADIERLEADRKRIEQERREQARREECPGCAEDIPVQMIERIGESEIFHLMHIGTPEWGACWCRRPDLHPHNLQSNLPKVRNYTAMSAQFDHRDPSYRYYLTREWGNGPGICFIGLNPSTADAETDDATIRRCVGFARSWGYDGLFMVNLFALRATDPKEMKRHPSPVGPDNDHFLLSGVAECETVVACWGAHGGHLGRDKEVLALLSDREIYWLGWTQGGQPRHPLFVPACTPLQRMETREP